MLDGNNDLVKYVRKRIISSIINFIFFFFLLGITYKFFILILDYFLIVSDFNLWLIMSYPIGFFILYFGIIPKTTNGYSLGGWLMNLKITKIDKSSLDILSMCKRAFESIFSYIKFLSFRRTVFNSRGQFYYDEKHNILVIYTKDLSLINIEEKDILSYEYNFLLDKASLNFILFIFFGSLLFSIIETFIVR